MISLVLLFVTTRMAMTEVDIFTSIENVQRMVNQEKELLEKLIHFFNLQNKSSEKYSIFYSERLSDVKARNQSSEFGPLTHPNAVYHTINNFAKDYQRALGKTFKKFKTYANSLGYLLADRKDVIGARRSLMRLQTVYNLKAVDMARGDYLGVQGPPLSYIDAYQLGQIAFTDNYLDDSLEWLNVSLTLYKHQEKKKLYGTSEDDIKALMGRVHVYNGSPHLGEALYYETIELIKSNRSKLRPGNGDIIELQKELKSQPRAVPKPPPVSTCKNFSKLCSLEKGIYPANPPDSRIVCRYRVALLPYYRYKEELLSITPFASVIYDVITDEEGEHMKDNVQGQMHRARVGGYLHLETDLRTGNVGWTDDKSVKIKGVSKRIELITSLDTHQNYIGPSSAEDFQVVNYGLGGHYGVHLDPLGVNPINALCELNSLFKIHPDITSLCQQQSEEIELLVAVGDRIATFLIYLSDVEKGGATVFTEAGISVSPFKNMALFWYNFDPACKVDQLTYHAGCPVLIGQKWIANKWILSHGSIFRRRCGLKRHATQLDIEADMRNGYK